MKLFISSLLLMFAGVIAEGQVVGGSSSGTVHDPNGAGVSGATVLVRQVETGATRTLTTEGDGRFFAPSVPVGHYAVTVKQEGFDPHDAPPRPKLRTTDDYLRERETNSDS